MLLSQIIALIGVALSFWGSVYLATRVFKPMASLQDILKRDYNLELKNISSDYTATSDTKKAFGDLISLLNTFLVDIEATEKDTSSRAKKGMIYLIIGALMQALALVLVLF